nr:cysteine-rich receptor-like protein kinase [Tanacetum cinerariifolium]
MAFLSGCQILDGVLIANELVNYEKRKNIKMLLFKVDFEKAFDNVNWIFLHVKEEMRFSLKWRNWVKNCLSLTSISVLVSGSTTWLVLNDGEVNMSLWQYADNALILGKWSRRNVRNLVTILKTECSGDRRGDHHRVIRSLHGANGGFSSNNGNGLLYKKGLWEGITDISLVIDNMGIPFRDSFIKKKITKIVILVIVRVRDSGEWVVCGDVPKSLDHVFLHCRKTNLIWSKCFRWWDIDTSINDKSVLDMIGGVVLRNKVVHATSKTKDEGLCVNIFTMAQANLLFGLLTDPPRGWLLITPKDWVLKPKETFASSTDG